MAGASTSQKAATSAASKPVKSRKSSSVKSSSLTSLRPRVPPDRPVKSLGTGKGTVRRAEGTSKDRSKPILNKSAAHSVKPTANEAPARSAVSSNPAPPLPPGPPIASAPPQNPNGPKPPPLDSLQVAAQVCSWWYVNSSLTGVFNSAQASAHETMKTLSEKLIMEEAGLADHKTRSEAERLVAFFDELTPIDSESKLSDIVQKYLRHEKAWEDLEGAVMLLASKVSIKSPSLLTFEQSGAMLQRLAQEQSDVTELLNELRTISSHSSRVSSILAGLIPVLRSRLENIDLARTLTARVRDNLSMTLHIESLANTFKNSSDEEQMSAIISDPFLLSSYGLSKRFIDTKDKDGRANALSNIFVSHHQSGGKEGYATVASHGDGVHVLDVSNLHLASSRTLGPSTSFSCPAVSRTVTENGSKTRRTYAVIHTSPDVKPEESDRTVWMWSDDDAEESSGRSGEKTSTVVPHPVYQMFSPDNDSTSLVLVSPMGCLSILDNDLNVRASHPYIHSDASVRRCFVFARPSCSFIPSVLSLPYVVVTFLFVKDTLQLSTSALGEERLTITQNIADISCSSSGYITVLNRNGTWTSFQLQQAGPNSVQLKQVSSPLRLAHLSFVTHPPSERMSDEISLLALNSSHVLLASISITSSELVLLLWDLQYSVLIASHTLPIPSTLSHSKEGVRIELVHASTTQALLALSPKLPKSPSSTSRSSILAVPFVTPAISTIANAIGRADRGKKWLAKSPVQSAADLENAGLDANRRNLLKTMRLAIEQKRQEAVDSAFFEWVEREKTALVKAQKRPMENSDAASPENGPELSHEFVRQLLDIVIQPSKQASASYSPKVVHYLLRRRVVSAGMVEGGLVPALQSCKDWQSIQLALQNVIDVSEDSIMSLLHSAVTSDRQQQKSDPNAMQVDTPSSDIPTLPTVLAACVAYPTSPAALRVAIRQQLPDAEDLVCVLEVLDGWLASWCSQDVDLLPSQVSKNARGILVPMPSERVETNPPIDKVNSFSVIAFLRIILDASFLTLLQHTRSHRLLRRISAHLEPELTLIDEVDQLRGPLEPFAKAQAKASLESVQGARKDTQVDWRRRKKNATRADGIGGWAVPGRRIDYLVPSLDIRLFAFVAFTQPIYDVSYSEGMDELRPERAVSDTASKDATIDKSGPTIKITLFAQGYDIIYQKIVPDEMESIRGTVQEWCASGNVDWIITSGGTGFGVRDRTPEAIGPLIERLAPGLVHLMLNASLQKTPLGALSRPVAGIINDTLVTTLPGSVKAVTEILDALLTGGVVDHAIELIKGGSGKSIHAALASSTTVPSTIQKHLHTHDVHSHHIDGHRHIHSHSHEAPKPKSILSHDPSLPATARHRVSPYRLFSFDEAMHAILKEIQPLQAEMKPVNSVLSGCILAEDVYALEDFPNTPTSNVDGYATRGDIPSGVYKVVTAATHKLSDVVPEGAIYRINTGGPLPQDTNTVIMVEDTRLVSSITDDDGNDTEEKEVELLVAGTVGENVRSAGSDVQKGDLVLQKGELLHSAGGEIGTLVFVGRKEVKVVRKPVVAILSTGNEILDLQNPQSLSGDGWGRIWDTNRPSLQAALEGLGYEVVDLGIVADTLSAHVEAIKQGLERADILLTTGGTSMGASDLLKPVIERHFNGTIHFGRVTIKPGKPTTFATIPVPGSKTDQKPIFALPGNPASALVTFHVFVMPALRRLGGYPLSSSQLPHVRVKVRARFSSSSDTNLMPYVCQLNDAMKLDTRVEFHRITIRAGADGLRAFSTGGQRSSRVASLSGANGLVILPQKVAGGPDRVEVDAELDAYVIGELQMT
ncbi:hypothetical protein EW146_g2730 [Bondarzewia mesenterica]|uniref:MoaB/Mog domain-containing protein n=1 Tax=Bondarzewia mesenterica TaxID=1095465 RepID=A0A4S4M077_9AGAM|nr:hypothetical protein EW146_g2730 [Bondarzewia mesenterica]